MRACPVESGGGRERSVGVGAAWREVRGCAHAAAPCRPATRAGPGPRVHPGPVPGRRTTTVRPGSARTGCSRRPSGPLPADAAPRPGCARALCAGPHRPRAPGPRSGKGGGVPPNDGQSAWWSHQSHSRLGPRPEVARLRWPARSPPTGRRSLRSVASRSASSGDVAQHLAVAEVHELQQRRDHAGGAPQHQRVELHLEQRLGLERLARRPAGLVVHDPDGPARRHVDPVDDAPQAQAAGQDHLHVLLAAGRLEPAAGPPARSRPSSRSRAEPSQAASAASSSNIPATSGSARAQPLPLGLEQAGGGLDGALRRPAGRTAARAPRARRCRGWRPGTATCGSRSMVRKRNSSGQVMKSPARDGDSEPRTGAEVDRAARSGRTPGRTAPSPRQAPRMIDVDVPLELPGGAARGRRARDLHRGDAAPSRGGALPAAVAARHRPAGPACQRWARQPPSA